MMDNQQDKQAGMLPKGTSEEAIEISSKESEQVFWSVKHSLGEINDLLSALGEFYRYGMLFPSVYSKHSTIGMELSEIYRNNQMSLDEKVVSGVKNFNVYIFDFLLVKMPELIENGYIKSTLSHDIFLKDSFLIEIINEIHLNHKKVLSESSASISFAKTSHAILLTSATPDREKMVNAYNNNFAKKLGELSLIFTEKRNEFIYSTLCSFAEKVNSEKIELNKGDSATSGLSTSDMDAIKVLLGNFLEDIKPLVNKENAIDVVEATIDDSFDTSNVDSTSIASLTQKIGDFERIIQSLVDSQNDSLNKGDFSTEIQTLLASLEQRLSNKIADITQPIQNNQAIAPQEKNSEPLSKELFAQGEGIEKIVTDNAMNIEAIKLLIDSGTQSSEPDNTKGESGENEEAIALLKEVLQSIEKITHPSEEKTSNETKAEAEIIESIKEQFSLTKEEVKGSTEAFKALFENSTTQQTEQIKLSREILVLLEGFSLPANESKEENDAGALSKVMDAIDKIGKQFTTLDNRLDAIDAHVKSLDSKISASQKLEEDIVAKYLAPASGE